MASEMRVAKYLSDRKNRGGKCGRNWVRIITADRIAYLWVGSLSGCNSRLPHQLLSQRFDQFGEDNAGRTFEHVMRLGSQRRWRRVDFHQG